MTRVAFLTCSLAFSHAQAQDLPDGKGKPLVEQLCVGCHGLEVVTAERATRRGWASILDDMGMRGMSGTSDEIQTILEYLVKNFGKEPGKINVNKATAKEIESTLELTPKEAEAIVKYRQDHGDFKDWDALTKVTGIAPQKLEGKKDRVTYN